MSEEKDLKKVTGEQPQPTETPDDGEGYAYCQTHKQRCLNDCIGGTPMLSHID